MKDRITILARFTLACTAVLLLFAALNCRAGLSLQFDFINNGDSGIFTCSPNLATNGLGADDTPTTYHQVRSPNGMVIGDLPGNSFDFRADFPDFNSLAHEMTNGSWQLILNVGATNQRTYTFTVSITNLTGSSFGVVGVDFPTDGATNVSATPTFVWHGPTTWDSIVIECYNDTFSVFQFNNLPATATSGTLPPAFPSGSYHFGVDYSVNATAMVATSNPKDTSNNTFIGWITSGQLDHGKGASFTVVAPSTNSPSLVAHYAFDDPNNVGTDSSGNGYDLDFNGGDGVDEDTDPANIKAGSGAAYFNGNSFLSYSSAPRPVMDALGGDMTVSIWVKTEQFYGNDGDIGWSGAQIMAADIPSSVDDIIPMALTGGQIAFNTGPDDDTLHSTMDINNGVYRHIVVTRRQITGAKQIYVDGVLNTSDFASTDDLNLPVEMALGAAIDASQSDPNNANPGQFYNGWLDDVQIYSTVLNSSQIAFLHANPGAVIGITVGPDFNTALNTTSLNWSTGGDTSWFVESSNTLDSSAAQSGPVQDDQVSTLSLTVNGPGYLTFNWQGNGSSGNFDYVLDQDGNYLDDIGGITDWLSDGPFIIPSGQHTLNWNAVANGDEDPTDAAYLDEVSYTQILQPVIAVNPFDQTNYPGYPVGLVVAVTAPNDPSLTWQWYKVGVGAILNATSPFYSPTNSGTAGAAGHYYAIVSNAAGSATTTTNTVTFISAPLPPDWTAAFKSPFLAQDSEQKFEDFYYGMTTDTNGNLYAASQFSGNVNVGNTTNVDSGPGGGGGLVKQTPTGSVLWAQCITNNGNGSCYAQCVAPAPGGGAYLSGNFSGSNWIGTTLLPTLPSGGVFLARFDASGNLVWVKTFGGASGGFIVLNSLGSDSSGNVTMTALFNSGPISIGANNFTVDGQESLVFQLNASGTVTWAQALPAEFSQYLVVNGGRVYISFSTFVSGGTTNAAVGTVTNTTDRAWAVAALDASNGQPIWIRPVGAQSGSTSGNPYYSGLLDDVPRLAASGSDLFLVGAAYDFSAKFGSLTVNFSAARGQYFVRYDTNGTAQTATTFGSITTTPLSAVPDGKGNVYVDGNFDTYAFFGQDLLAASREALQYTGDFSQGFLAKFDRNGNSLWARMAVSPATVNLLGIAPVSDGVWVSGFCRSTNVPGGFPATVFGTNNVYGDDQFLVGGAGGGVSLLGHAGGVLAKVTDVSTSPLAVTLVNQGLSGTNYSFSFISTSGHTNTVQFTTNLATHLWSTYTNIVGDGTSKSFLVPATSPAQKFFRVSTQ